MAAPARFALTLLLPLLAPEAALAQWDWQPVSDAERATTAGAVDPKAGAEALFVKVRIEDSYKEGHFSTSEDRYVRIKVFNQAGAEQQTNIKIPHVGRGERLTDVAARTLLPDGTELKAPASSMKDEVLYRAQGRALKVLSIAMPRVEPGAIIEYRWRVMTPDGFYGGYPIDVQFEIPIRRVEVDIKPLMSDDWMLQIMPYSLAATVPSEPIDGWYHCVAENVRAAVDEPYSAQDLRRRGFLLPYYLRKSWSSTDEYWPSLAKGVAEEREKYLGSPASIADLARTVVGDASADSVKAQRLVRWCRRELRAPTAAENARRSSRELVPTSSEVLETRVGRDEDVARALVGMARAVGLQADEVLLESRDGIAFRKEVMCALPLRYFAVRLRSRELDKLCTARASGVPWDGLPWEVEGMRGLVCSEKGAEVMTSPTTARSGLRRFADVVLRPTGDVEGSLRVQLTGHWAETWLDRTRDPSRRESTLRSINRWNSDNGKLSDITSSTYGPDSDTVVVRAAVKWPAFATVTGKRVLLQPTFWAAREPALFPAESRQSPVVFAFAWDESDSISFHLPTGCTLEPADRLEPFTAVPLLEHELGIVAQGNPESVLCVRHITWLGSGQTSFPRSGYAEVRRAFQVVAERDQFTLTLTRAQP